MRGNVVDTFRQQEAEQMAAKLRYNRWSQVLIDLLIAEYEEKLLASDLPVEEEGSVPFWEHI